MNNQMLNCTIIHTGLIDWWLVKEKGRPAAQPKELNDNDRDRG